MEPDYWGGTVPPVPTPLLFLDEAMREKAGLEVSLLCSTILFYLHIPHNETHLVLR